MTNTNYRKVSMEAYQPTGEGRPSEYGLITLSQTLPQSAQNTFPDFSSGNITFDSNSGFPNGGRDFVENDTQ